MTKKYQTPPETADQTTPETAGFAIATGSNISVAGVEYLADDHGFVRVAPEHIAAVMEIMG